MRRALVIAAGLAVVLATPLPAAGQDNVESTAPPAELTAKPPFRLGYLQLNPTLDAEKPLAASDAAGFVLNSGVLIGAFDKQWVGGLSMDTRRILWWFDGGSELTTPPGSFGSSVVLGFRDGKIVKLDALTGNKLWTVTIDSFSERSFLLNGTTLFVLSAAQVLHALDFQTGRTLWLFDGGFPEGLTIRGGARPIVHDNKILFGVASGEILAVQAETGKPVWRYNPAYNDQRFHDVVGEIVVRNNKLILSRYDGLVAAIDLASSVRTLAWQQQLPGLSSSAFRNGRFYVGGLNGDVYAIDPDTGRKVWRSITGKPVNTITAGETQLFVGGADGRITALDAANGHVLWHDELGTAIASAPILVEDAIYYTTGMKGVYAYKLR